MYVPLALALIIQLLKDSDFFPALHLNSPACVQRFGVEWSVLFRWWVQMEDARKRMWRGWVNRSGGVILERWNGLQYFFWIPFLLSWCGFRLRYSRSRLLGGQQIFFHTRFRCNQQFLSIVYLLHDRIQCCKMNCRVLSSLESLATYSTFSSPSFVKPYLFIFV